MIGLKWKGATLDPSGYGCANRDFIVALHRAGVNITIEPWNHEAHVAEFYGEAGLLVQELKNRDIPYDTVVHHLVPNDLERYYEPDKINVGYSTWETDKLPEHWVDGINKYMQLQLVPSEYNKEVYKNSGVTVPIGVVPHCFDHLAYRSIEKIDFGNAFVNGAFKFLSVFQWIERKNPLGLLKAYYTEFYENKKVVLIIKSYGMNHSKEERDRLKSIIELMKKEMQLDPLKCPAVLFIPEVITTEQMRKLYATCDCFVLPSKSEGFGMPYAEACAAGLTVVAPNYGGQKDFLDIPFAYLTDWQKAPVAHMYFPHYNGLMNWCEPDISDFKRGMRTFYAIKSAKPEEYNSLYRKSAQEMVEDKLSYKEVGKLFKAYLEAM